MLALPTCRTPRELAAVLAPRDAGRVERARAEASLRPIPYPLGSGESDEVALFANIKPLVRQLLPLSELASTRRRFESLGLAVVQAKHRVPAPSTEGVVIFVSRDARRALAAAEVEATAEHDAELGRLLGFPRCCVEAYLGVPAPRRNPAVLARAHAASGGVFEPRLNTLDLAVFHYTSWLPCSFSCALSKAFADAVADHIARRHGQFLRKGVPTTSLCPPRCRHETFVAALDEALGAHRLLLHEDVQVSIAGPIEGHRVHVERAWPTARDRHPGAHLDGDAREAVARLVAVIEEAGSVAVEEGVLFAGGQAVARTDDALLVPFGAPHPDGPAPVAGGTR